MKPTGREALAGICCLVIALCAYVEVIAALAAT